MASNQKIRRHAKKQKNMTCTKEKNLSIEIDTDVTQMLKLADKDIKQLLKMYSICSQS